MFIALQKHEGFFCDVPNHTLHKACINFPWMSPPIILSIQLACFLFDSSILQINNGVLQLEALYRSLLDFCDVTHVSIRFCLSILCD